MTVFDICIMAIGFCSGVLVEYFRLRAQLKDCEAEYDKAVRYIADQNNQLDSYRRHFAKEVRNR